MCTTEVVALKLFIAIKRKKQPLFEKYLCALKASVKMGQEVAPSGGATVCRLRAADAPLAPALKRRGLFQYCIVWDIFCEENMTFVLPCVIIKAD